MQLILSCRATADHRIRKYDSALSEALDGAHDNPGLFQMPSNSSFTESHPQSESNGDDDYISQDSFNKIFESIDMNRTLIEAGRQRSIVDSVEQSTVFEEEPEKSERKTEKQKYLIDAFLHSPSLPFTPRPPVPAHRRG